MKKDLISKEVDQKKKDLILEKERSKNITTNPSIHKKHINPSYWGIFGRA